MKNDANKRITKFILFLLVLLTLCDLYLRNIDRFAKMDYGLSGAIMILLGVPDDSGGKSQLSKMTEIINISEEEWNTPACLPIDKLDCSMAKKVGDTCELIPVKGLAPLKDCVSISPSKIDSPYCNHWNFRDCKSFSIYDYILQRPDILDVIIKILERPCQYIPTKDELLKKERYSEFTNALIFRNARDSMNCDSEDKKPYITILNIKNKHRETRFDIVIKRKE